MAAANIDEIAIIGRVKSTLGPFTLFDVGAADGEYTEAVLDRIPECLPYLFEPRSEAAAALRERYRNVHQLALGDTHEEIKLVLGDDLQQSHLRGVFEGERWETVTMTTLDLFLATHPVKGPIFLKIDTEGYEVPVIMGATESLASGLIPAIQFEYGGTWPSTRHWKLQDAVDLLTGFTIYEYKNERLQPITSTEDDYEYRNYLALRNA